MGSRSVLDMTDTELDAVLTEIDRELRQENDRIPGRELRGWIKFCEKYRLKILMSHPFSQRIFDWFKHVYGSRLNLDGFLGTTVVDIKGDLYRMRGVRFFGAMYVICAPTLIGRTVRHVTVEGTVRTIWNLADNNRIHDLTPELASRLSEKECNNILSAYSRMFIAFWAMAEAIGGAYIKEAIDDLTSSAENLLASNPNYGQANWQALQASEKVIKSYILAKGGTHGKIHKLAELFSNAYELGLPQVDSAVIQAIQCTPDVRYDSKRVNRGKAVAAHCGALEVSGVAAPLMKRLTSESALQSVQICISGTVFNGLMLGFQPMAPGLAQHTVVQPNSPPRT
jgi:hypothetical protein